MARSGTGGGRARTRGRPPGAATPAGGPGGDGHEAAGERPRGGHATSRTSAWRERLVVVLVLRVVDRGVLVRVALVLLVVLLRREVVLERVAPATTMVLARHGMASCRSLGNWVPLSVSG